MLADDVDLVLYDDNLVHTDDAEGHQVLLRLGLRDVLVRGDYKEGAVHDRGPAEHRRHEGLVARGVHEADRPEQLCLRPVVLADLARPVVPRGLILRALVEGGVRVPEADRDAPLDLLGMAVRGLPREELHDRGLAVVDLADGPDVHGRLDGYFHGRITETGTL